jgi:choline kinase
MTIDSAVIMAAGLGSRIPQFSRHNPKGFISVGGQPIVERSIEILIRHGIRHIVIGTGYRAEDYEAIARRYADIRIDCVLNADYANSGSLETLLRCGEHLTGDFLSLESDLLYDSRMIGHLLNIPSANVILASGETQSGDEVYIETNDHSELVRLSKNPAELARIDAELIGICKLAESTPRALKQWLAETGQIRPALQHYEEGLAAIADTVPLRVDKVDMAWTEIDTLEHLERANKLIWPRIQSAERGLL